MMTRSTQLSLARIRFLPYARRSWRRLGHLKLLCSIASPSQSIDLEGITSRLQSLVTLGVKIPEADRSDIVRYIKSHRSNSRQYKSPESVDTVELQDYYLSSSGLPSQSGALTGRFRQVSYTNMEYVEIPTWATNLQLIRRGNYTLTDRGRVVSALADYRTYNKPASGINPFILNAGEKYVFAYCLFDSDGDILWRLYRQLATSTEPVTKDDIRGCLVNAVSDLAKLTAEGRVRSRENESVADVLNKMNAMIKTLENETDQLINPRVEPLLDCSLLDRPDQRSVGYRMPVGLPHLIAEIDRQASIGSFLEKSLARSMVVLLGLDGGENPGTVRQNIVKSYSQLRSGLGYCSIREVALLSVANCLNAGTGYFELDEAENEIMRLQKEFAPGVRYTKDRQGNVALFKIDLHLLRDLDGKP